MAAVPDLEDLIAEVDRTCDRAHRGAASEQPDWIELLTTATGVAGQLNSLANDLVEDYVEHCRLHGYSWADIGAALGVTRQAVQQRFPAPHKQYRPEEFADELRQAMTSMKQIAVHQRNNYIGTEHLLWGLLAADNTATKLLTALGVCADELRRLLAARLSLGASRAAERIAWTPHSRRAMALARELADTRGCQAIGCDHLLVGLGHLGRGVAATVFHEAGIDQDRLDTAIADAP